MIDYIDPIPPIVGFFISRLDVNVYGNAIPYDAPLPCLLVKNAGGTDYTRVQLLCRAGQDFEATSQLIEAMNLLQRYASTIEGLQVVWCERETAPIPDSDADTGKPEAWCYMRLEHLEAQ